MANDFGQLEKNVKEILGNPEAEQSQQEIPATEGQELENLSSFEGNASDKCIFDFEDDIVDENSFIQSDTLQNEMRHYKSLTMSAADKDKTNVLQWWKEHKALFPSLFKAAQAYLHIPATSVPSERIFSLAGYIVHDRRSKILATNVNKSIFLKRNEKHIPPETSIWTS